jgi:hypothetical protein
MAAMFLDLRFDQRTVVRLQLREGAFVVGAHQAAVAYDIGRKDSADPPFGTLSLQSSLHEGVTSLRTLHRHQLPDKVLDGAKRRLIPFPRAIPKHRRHSEGCERQNNPALGCAGPRSWFGLHRRGHCSPACKSR